MMLKSIFLIAALQTPPPAEPVARESVVSATLDIPDEIAPAVVPYMMCLLGSAGIEMRREGQAVAPAAEKGADCSGQRKLAAERADKMLKQAGRGDREARTAFIEKTLVSMERFSKPSEVLLPPGKRP
jgi:hypothetical protein